VDVRRLPGDPETEETDAGIMMEDIALVLCGIALGWNLSYLWDYFSQKKK